MPRVDSFGAVVAARTRTAELILGTPELLKLYEDNGGLREDLEEIVEHGSRAELLSQARGTSQALGGGATMKVLQSFAELQAEYKAVMAVLQAVERDLARAKAAPEVRRQIARIRVDETEVLLRTVEPAAEGAPKRREARKSNTQEAVRAEIHRDATSLVALTPAHKALARRKVDLARLKKLQAAAKGLSGKLAERTAARGASKAATASLREEVARQKEGWSAVYRILHRVGRSDERVRALLKEAARPR